MAPWKDEGITIVGLRVAPRWPMARRPTFRDADALSAQIAALEQENDALRSRLTESERDQQAASKASAEHHRQHEADLADSRSAAAKAESDLRRTDAQIARAEARHTKDRERDRAELASAQGIIAALESVQLAARDGEERMRALLRAASDYAVIEMDPKGRITFWNSGAEALLGWSEQEALGQNAGMVFTPEDRDAGAPEKERTDALVNGQSDSERWHVRKDGSRFYAHERVIASTDGKRQRFLKLLRNRSEEHEIEEARRASEEQMRLILNSAMDYAIFTLNRDGIVTTWNLGAERLLGFKDVEIIGQNGRIVFTPEDREAGQPEKEISTALTKGRAEDERWHMRKDGSRFWGSGLMLPLKAEGTPGLLKIMRDETARHRADQMNQLLIGELNHRVKNTLGVVQAIVRETLRGRVAETDIRDALDSRLTALARSHDILAQENWEGASLLEVVRRTLKPFVVRGKLEDRVLIEGEDVRLMPAPALSLGMGFHELATNAAKYGALSVSEGIVEVSWTRESEGKEAVRLTWRERNGPAVSPPKQKGFGSRLIERALAYEMNGTAKVDYAPDGLRFEISIPETALQGVEHDGR
jgi:PAS domain S-box-containing protein